MMLRVRGTRMHFPGNQLDQCNREGRLIRSSAHQIVMITITWCRGMNSTENNQQAKVPSLNCSSMPVQLKLGPDIKEPHAYMLNAILRRFGNRKSRR
jgi:hypothetical protein